MTMIKLYIIISYLLGVTSVALQLNILIGEDKPEDTTLVKKWIDLTVLELQKELDGITLTYNILWINHTNIFMLALQSSQVDGNETVVLDLTGDCFLASTPEFSNSIYLSMSYCDSSIPSLTPSSLYLLQASVDLLSSQNINLEHIAIILDDSQEIIEDGTAAILNGSALTMIPLENSTLIDHVLRRLVKESTSLATIVIGTREQNKYVLQTACNLESLLASVYWVIITTDWVDIECPPCKLDSIIYMRQRWKSLDKTFYHNLPEDVKSTITQKEAYRLWDSLRGIVGMWNMSLGVSDMDTRTKIPTASGKLILKEDNVAHIVELDVYEMPCQANNSGTSVIGKWYNRTMEWYNETRLTEAKVYKLRVATFHEPPFVFKDLLDNGNISYRGYAIDVLRTIMEELGHEYEIFESDDKTYGSLMPNGEWNGLVGELVHGTADIAIGPISVTAERESVVDFTTPYYDFAGIQIVMKKTTAKPNMFAFSDVFALEVWLCWAGVLCTTAILIFIFERFSPFSTRNAEGSVSDTIYTFKECWWFVVTSFTMSGSESTPRPMSTRLLVAGFWFFCSIMMSTYTANLAAHLTLSRLTDPVESLDDLAAQSKIKYSALEGSTVQTYFTRMAEIEKNFYTLWKDMSYGDIKTSALKDKNYAVWDYPLGDKYQNIWKNMANFGFLNSSKQGMAKVNDGDFAFFHDSPMIKYEMSMKCDLQVIGSQFSTKPYAFALRENSAHTKMISSKILELQQERTLDSFKETWWNMTAKECKTNDENDGLTFETVAGIFIVMAAGTVFSILVLIVELSCNKISQRKKDESAEDMKDQRGFQDGLKSDGSCSTLSSRL